MLEWAVTSSILILVVLVLRRCLKGHISPRLQYSLWALVLLRLLVPMNFIHTEWSVLNGLYALLQSEKNTVSSSVAPVDEVEPQLPIVQPDYSLTPELSVVEPDASFTSELPILESGTSQSPEHTERTELQVVLSVIWSIGAAGLGLWLVWVNLRFARALCRSRTSLTVEGCPLPVYVSGAAATPCLFGLVRPAIYMPPDMASQPTLLRHSVAHEYTHFRHGDHIWALLRGLCLVLHWYNPLVWVAAALSRQDGELCCDEATIRRLGAAERAAYGRTLIAITCQGRTDPMLTATSMTGNGNSLRERIAQLVRRPRTALPALLAAVLVAGAAVGCTFTGALEEPDSFRPDTVRMGQLLSSSLSPDPITDPDTVARLWELYQSFTLDGTAPGPDQENIWSITVTFQDSGSEEREGFTIFQGGLLCLEGDWDTYYVLKNGAAIYQEFYAVFDQNQAHPAGGRTELASADLDWDGEREHIEMEGAGSVYQLVVTKEDGRELFREEMGLAHVGWDSLYLYTAPSGGVQYLLRYTPTLSNGTASYQYTLFSLEGGEPTVCDSGGIDFQVSEVEEIAPKLMAFADDVNRLLRSSSLLLSTQDGKLLVGPEEPGEHLEALEGLGLEDALTTADVLPIPPEGVELTFSSGAGAWRTQLTLYPDGTFQGEFQDTDMDLVYVCTFRGRFGQFEAYQDHAYLMTLEELNITTPHPVGEEWSQNGMRYISAAPYGLEDGTEFVLYAPHVPAAQLPQAFLSWFNGDDQRKKNLLAGEGTLSCWGLYHRAEGYGFFSP